MSLEAMKQAFNSLREMRNALSRAHDTMRRPTKYVIAAMKENESAITALRQAIEQAEMVEKGTKAWADTPDNWVDDLRGGTEPVAWREMMGKWKTHYYDYNEDGRGESLYTAPPKREWVGLTDHELQVLDFNDSERGKLARAVEAKLKERNT